jgi:integrase
MLEVKHTNPLGFLKQYDSKNTVKSYKSSIKSLLEAVYSEAEVKNHFRGRDRGRDYDSALEELAIKYLSEPRDYEEDVDALFISLKDYAPKSVRLRLAVVKVFFMENGVELPQIYWRRLRRRIKGSRAQTIDQVPSNEELRKIIMHLPVHGNALYLLLSSSGMRMGETLQLLPEDFDLDAEPARINIRGEYTKTGNPRIAFMSREAAEAVKEWYKIRDEYLETSSGRSHFYDKDEDDDRVFPFTDSTARYIWNKALDKTGNGKLDASTGIHKLHPHVLRKFFRTELSKVIPVDVVEALMGHEGYLTEVYRRYSMRDLADFYQRGEHALLVFTEVGEVNRLREEVEEQRNQLQRIVNGVSGENLELKSRLARVELAVTELKKMLQEMM